MGGSRADRRGPGGHRPRARFLLLRLGRLRRHPDQQQPACRAGLHVRCSARTSSLKTDTTSAGTMLASSRLTLYYYTEDRPGSGRLGVITRPGGSGRSASTATPSSPKPATRPRARRPGMSSKAPGMSSRSPNPDLPRRADPWLPGRVRSSLPCRRQMTIQPNGHWCDDPPPLSVTRRNAWRSRAGRR
jgi:hypothetical protein